MPADMRLHIIFQSHFGESKSFLGIALGVEDESFHRLCVAMVGVFSQDLVCCFEAWWGQIWSWMPLHVLNTPFLYCLPS